MGKQKEKKRNTKQKNEQTKKKQNKKKRKNKKRRSMWRGESYSTFPTPFKVLVNNNMLFFLTFNYNKSNNI